MSSINPGLALVALSISCIEYNHKPIEPIDDRYATIRVSPEFIDFGPVPEGESKNEVLTVSNVGNDVLDIEEIFLADGAFSYVLPEDSSHIEPGESVDMLVSYQPINISDSRKMRIDSNDLNAPSVDVPLLGQAAYPALRISPSPYSFAWTEVGSTTEGIVKFESIGPVPITIENALVLGEAFASGDVSFPFTIPAGESVDFPVTFSPSAEQDYQGDLWVQSDAPGPDSKIDLFGYSGAGSLSGRICNPSGDGWIVGAQVSVSIDFDGDGVEDVRLQDMTDADGRYTLEGVPMGTWTVYVTKGSYSTEFEVNFPGGSYELPEETCLDPNSVNVAVVLGDFDNIGAILSRLDIEYDAYGRQDYLDLLRSPDKLSEYDIVFFNCGMPMEWITERGVISSNLRDYVEKGGSIYASDWAHAIVEATFPYAIDFHGDDDIFASPELGMDHDHPYVGAATSFQADVIDETMRGAIGSSHAQIVYDLDSWVLPTSIGPSSIAMITGPAQYYSDWNIGTQPNTPLAVQFAEGGTVIYTTFHNEHQMTQDMEAALKEIILSL